MARLAQQENYEKSGFALAYTNVRYGGTVVAAPAEPPASVIPLSEVPFATVEADDAPPMTAISLGDRRYSDQGSVQGD